MGRSEVVICRVTSRKTMLQMASGREAEKQQPGERERPGEAGGKLGNAYSRQAGEDQPGGDFRGRGP